MGDVVPFRPLAQLADDFDHLLGGGGGGTSGGMEVRLARLESDMEHVKKSLDRLVDVPKDLGVLQERVAHLPSKGFIVTVTLVALTLVAALSAFVQWVLAGHPLG